MKQRKGRTTKAKNSAMKFQNLIALVLLIVELSVGYLCSCYLCCIVQVVPAW